jgi:hypothetical protein
MIRSVAVRWWHIAAGHSFVNRVAANSKCISAVYKMKLVFIILVEPVDQELSMGQAPAPPAVEEPITATRY